MICNRFVRYCGGECGFIFGLLKYRIGEYRPGTFFSCASPSAASLDGSPTKTRLCHSSHEFPLLSLENTKGSRLCCASSAYCRLCCWS